MRPAHLLENQPVSRTLLLNVREPEECRAVLLEDGRPSLAWVERTDEHSLVGNIYLGRVTHVEPAIEAVFVDVGLGRPAFLHRDDVMPTLADLDAPPLAAMPRPAPGTGKPIGELLQKGRSVVVQVTRDQVGNKGPNVTTHLSLAGRTVVLMPSLGRVGVSRRIQDPEARQRLRSVLELRLPEGLGLVARSAAEHADAEELELEVDELLDEYAELGDALASAEPPQMIRREREFVRRAVIELLGRAPEESEGPTVVIVDTPDGADRVHAVLDRCAGSGPEIRVHDSEMPLFHDYGVEAEIRKLAEPRVPVEGGAFLVIQPTEALWAVDVNSGRLRKGSTLEETALEVDLRAAKETARQIRLRDLGGLIVVDFIDCRDPDNRRRVEQTFRAELSRDPARMRIGYMTEFMVMHVTRRRLRRGPASTGSGDCPCCRGRGLVRSPSAARLAALRDVRAALAAGAAGGVELRCAEDIAREFEAGADVLRELEATYGVPVRLTPAPELFPDQFHVRSL